MIASLIIPAHNSAATLPLLLDSLNRQNFANFEVVLVDDASTDDTPRIAQDHRGNLDLTVIQQPENQGRAQARNRGLQNSRGEIILLLDSDYEVVPGYVSAHMALHRDLPEAVGVGAARFPPYLAGHALARYLVTRGGAKLAPGSPLPGKYFLSNLASFPRQLYEATGGFDPRISFYGEDLELGLRFQKLGAQLRYLPEAIGYHHHLRPLNETLDILQRYGRVTIPLILERHPEFAREMVLDDMIALSSRGSITTLARQVICAGIFFYPLAALANLFQRGPLPYRFLDYLTWRSYRRGFANSLSDNHLKLDASRR